MITSSISAQKTYFIDGYHGGIYGHYPRDFTDFILKNLDRKKDWKINLEIEPETWDSVQSKYPESYARFKQYFEQQYPQNSSIEFVNPAYGQAYFFNISGESIIRQFAYGIKKMREHFPAVRFDTYSSEEPCFTSSLPMILKSFGFKYASLKNPNTCWGGYTRAHGGAILNWVGPDGSKIPTVPRYHSEALVDFSTWQTQAWTNSQAFITAARSQGIQNPVGMCLQDAGWKIGPWLEQRQSSTEYTTWYQYFTQVAPEPTEDWRLSQEDIQVSLMWGSQKLQQIAQGVRVTEQRLIQAEKVSVLAQIYGGYQRPSALIDEAWRNLLLAQHHDCWIVPLHWYKRALQWLEKSNGLIDSILDAGQKALIQPAPNSLTIINTSGLDRRETVRALLPAAAASAHLVVTTPTGRQVPTQVHLHPTGDSIELFFVASVPATSAVTYQISTSNRVQAPDIQRLRQKPASKYVIETDLYKLTLDSITGTIKSLITKKDNQELVDPSSVRKFNEIKGAFYNQRRWISSTDQKNTITFPESGTLQKKIRIAGKLGIHDFVQCITLVDGQRRIAFETAVYWKKNEGIGDDHAQHGGYDSKDPYKAFYVDTAKLLVSFPLAIRDPKLFKDAPFDVTESALSNTFYSRWDQIKNNIIYRWVDLTDRNEKKGVALFADHTTSYSYGPQFPLSLTLAYSGYGLWDGVYRLSDSTKVSYTLVPHSGNWSEGDLNKEAAHAAEPLIIVPGKTRRPVKSVIKISNSGYEVTSLNLKSDTLIARIYNGQGRADQMKIRLQTIPKAAQWVHLDGRIQKAAVPRGTTVESRIPAFGLGTLEILLK